MISSIVASLSGKARPGKIKVTAGWLPNVMKNSMGLRYLRYHYLLSFC